MSSQKEVPPNAYKKFLERFCDRNATCRLCHAKGNLQDSHIIPKFCVAWLKETSATGFMRQGVEPNLRMQDGPKGYLLCWNCEQMFSAWEKAFNDKIFLPYVESLNDAGSYAGSIDSVEYEEWLLKVVISIQWRAYFLHSLESLDQDWRSLYQETHEIWRRYLMGEISRTGQNSSYLLLLQSIAGATSYIDRTLPENVNFYLLRTFDATPVFLTKKIFGHYLKAGPFVFYTRLHPRNQSSGSDSRIGKSGKLKFKNITFDDKLLNEFIYFARPREVADKAGTLSDRQQEKIDAAIRKDPERASGSLTAAVRLLDYLQNNDDN